MTAQDCNCLDPELAALWQSISQRRAKNMRLFAADLATTGRLRPDLSVAKAADIIWSMNSPEFYLLLVEERGWSPPEFENWLVDAWIRLCWSHERVKNHPFIHHEAEAVAFVVYCESSVRGRVSLRQGGRQECEQSSPVTSARLSCPS